MQPPGAEQGKTRNFVALWVVLCSALQCLAGSNYGLYSGPTQATEGFFSEGAARPSAVLSKCTQC